MSNKTKDAIEIAFYCILIVAEIAFFALVPYLGNLFNQ